MVYAFLAGIVLTVGISAQFAFQEVRAGKPAFVLIMLIPSAVLAALGIFRAHREGGVLYRRASIDDPKPTGWFAVRSGDFTVGALSALLLFGLTWSFTHVVTPPDSKHLLWIVRLYTQIGDADELRKHVSYVIGAIIVIAVVEEILWRGVVTSLLEEVVGSRRAWIFSAVLYATAHVPTIWVLGDKVAGPNPTVFLAALAAGLTWGFMARRFNRLLPGVFSHVLFDWVVVMMFRLWGPGV